MHLLLVGVVGGTLLTGLTGCGSMTSIGDILADPSQYMGKTVTVSGMVGAPYSVFGVGAYTVRDSTGEIWVLTASRVPPTGETVEVTGMVSEAATIAGESIGTHLAEKRRKVR